MATKKFLFLEAIYNLLTGWGLNENGANFITFSIACLTLLLIIWLLKLVFSRVFSSSLRAVIRHGHSQLDHFFQKRKFYKRFVNIIAAIAIVATSRILFQGFSDQWLLWADRIIGVYTVIVALQLCFSILNVVNDVYETKPQAQYRSIRSMVQTIQIILAMIAGIIMLSFFLSEETARGLLLSLGAFAAIIALIFRDPILGFVASIQVSAQDMFRPGDWVEIPSRNANGKVEEINVTSIKIRNWDNSVSMVPAYVMITESFTNWRNMQESSGRRFKRPLLVDINSIGVIDGEGLDKIVSHPLIDPALSEKMIALMNETNTSHFMTNMGLYRSYIEVYLQNHPKVNHDQLRLVRYLDNSMNGITLELYAYSVEKSLFEYEHIVADIFENIMAVMPVFGLKAYQRPTSLGTDR